MFSKRKCSFTRNIAILVCVALVTMIVPEATHAAASSSKGGSSSSKDSFPISSSVLSAAGLAISLVVYQLYYQYVLSGGSTSSTLPVTNLNKVSNSSGSATISDNSDSNKKPKDKD